MDTKLKVYVSGAPAGLTLEKYEILPKFDPYEIDVMVVFADSPTFEQGYEVATALEKYSKPVLALIKSSSSDNLSKIDHPMYTLATYSDISLASSLVEEKVNKHFPQLEPAVCATDICAV